MTVPKRVRKAGVGSDSDVHAAQNYLDSLLASEDDLSSEDVQAIRDSVDAVRRGEMTLAEFEEKYGL